MMNSAQFFSSQDNSTSRSIFETNYVELERSKSISFTFSLHVTAVQEQETDSEPTETKQVEKSMHSQMLCELQRVKKEMLDNSQLVSKSDV